MLDNRIYTFLKLCELMNYRAAAESLNMTQPAVTQHIQGLERDFGCRLFKYNKKTLAMTPEAEELQRCAQGALYNEKEFREYLSEQKAIPVRIGATKTIGNYAAEDKITRLLKDKRYRVTIDIDNTENLLNRIDRAELDFALVEGYFDKSKYKSSFIKKEEFLGLCPKEHRFAGKDVNISDLKNELLILREKGSGTRTIFEQIISEENYGIDYFNRIAEVSSFELLKKCIISCGGISFAYKAVADSDKRLATFKLHDEKIYREFNYVYLKNSMSERYVEIFKNI